MSRQRKRGTIKFFDANKGFGFILPEETGKNIYLNWKSIDGAKAPEQGDTVEFDLGRNAQGVCAEAVQVVRRAGRTSGRSPDGEAAGRAQRSRTGPATLPAPYTFVPVRLAQADKHAGDAMRVHTPLLQPPGHDGRQAAGKTSGELRLTITAHTPLLVGSTRYALDLPNSSPYRPATDGKLKHLVEPWRRHPDGRVVLAGSSIKGMIRHYLSALLNSPMERVREHYFSYRPNLDFPKSHGWVEDGAGGRCRLEVREAVVIGWNYGGSLKVELMPPGRHAAFVRDAVVSENAEILIKGHILPQGTRLRSAYATVDHKTDMILRIEKAEKDSSVWTAERSYRIIDYHGGIDGAGQMSYLYGSRKADAAPPFVYETVLLPCLNEETDEALIEQPTLTQYVNTYAELRDAHFGHLSSRHPHLDKAQVSIDALIPSQENYPSLKPGSLIYVELRITEGQGSGASEVVSFGHHFRYRWRYRDTVRRHESRTGPLRTEVSVQKDENVTGTDGTISASLTPARALFGYAADKDLHGEKFIGDFARLAGRIAINHALEVVTPPMKANDDSRFISCSGSLVLPLRELGSPKPSAVEFYVKQERSDNESGRLTTYGDLADSPPSVLAGRKFYRHQPPAADPDCSCNLACDQGSKRNDRAALARYVSGPSSMFKCTLRFRDLSHWELGALLFIVGIHRAEQFRSEHFEEAESSSSANDSAPPSYALKLGYGRPLGWGSITMDLDSVACLLPQCSSEGLVEEIKNVGDWQFGKVRVFLKDWEKTHSSHLDECLRAWSYAGRGEAEYPKRTVRGKAEIFNYHTELRRTHSRNRRSSEGASQARDLTEKLQVLGPGWGQNK